MLSDKKIFDYLVRATAEFRNIPEHAVVRDYLICKILERLSKSEFKERCVSKGGTSLSKCYPNTIERFSEDIDLTYLPNENESIKSIEKALKRVELLLGEGLVIEKIESERSNRNKSAYLYDECLGEDYRIKLEIGSSVRPEPYSLHSIKTYFQEFLEILPNGKEYIEKYNLNSFEVNTLNIERTFMDKIFAIKRHSLEGGIESKARHIYDVFKLWNHKEIKDFVADKNRFKQLSQLIKSTDAEYLSGKRECNVYIPNGNFDYELWRSNLDNQILRENYERLHKELLYTDEKQKLSEALNVLEEIGNLFVESGE